MRRHVERVDPPAGQQRPLYFGELPIVFWLLIWGARTRPTDATTTSTLRTSGSAPG